MDGLAKEGCDENFRLFLTAEPTNLIPAELIGRTIKLTNGMTRVRPNANLRSLRIAGLKPLSARENLPLSPSAINKAIRNERSHTGFPN